MLLAALLSNDVEKVRRNGEGWHDIRKQAINLLGRHCTLTCDPQSLRWQRQRGRCRPCRGEWGSLRQLVELCAE